MPSMRHLLTILDQFKNITYYDMGYINEIHTAITQIDCTNKKVVTTDSIISFDDLVKLENA